MDLREHFLARYEGYRQRVENWVGLLTDKELRHPPFLSPSFHYTAPAYLWWEIARLEDRSFAALADRSQVITEPDWLQRMAVTQPEADQAGTDPSTPTDEKNYLGLRINLVGLREYWEAVGARTRDIAASLPLETFDDLVSSALTVCSETDRTWTFWTLHYRSGRVSQKGPLDTPAYGVLSRLGGHWRESSAVFGVVIAHRESRESQG